MKTLLLTLVLLTISSTAAADYARSIVQVLAVRRTDTVTGAKFTHWTGHGFFIEKRLVVTAKHVVEGATSLVLRRGSRSSYGRVVYMSKQYDIAIIETLRKGDPIPVCRSFKRGGRITLRLINNVSFDGIMRYDSFYGWSSDIPVVPGNSGSPAYHGVSGTPGECVAAMAVAYYPHSNISKYEPWTHIQRALLEYGKERQFNRVTVMPIMKLRVKP